MNIFEYMGVGENEKPLDRMVTDGGFCAIFRSIACIGDSLSSGEFESKDENGNTGYHDMFEYSWGQFIGRSCGSKVYNFSCGGMTAKGYVESFAEANGFWGEDKLCQAYIIALGVNDIFNAGWEIGSVADIDREDYTKNAKTFAGYYAYIIQRIKSMQPKAKFFLVTTPRGVVGKEALQKAHRDFLKELTEVFENTYLIDLYEYSPVQDDAFREVYWLGHMTPTGYVLTARMIESYIDYIIRKNPKEFAQVGFIGTGLSYPQK